MRRADQRASCARREGQSQGVVDRAGPCALEVLLAALREVGRTHRRRAHAHLHRSGSERSHEVGVVLNDGDAGAQPVCAKVLRRAVQLDDPRRVAAGLGSDVEREDRGEGEGVGAVVCGRVERERQEADSSSERRDREERPAHRRRTQTGCRSRLRRGTGSTARRACSTRGGRRESSRSLRARTSRVSAVRELRASVRARAHRAGCAGR